MPHSVFVGFPVSIDYNLQLFLLPFIFIEAQIITVRLYLRKARLEANPKGRVTDFFNSIS